MQVSDQLHFLVHLPPGTNWIRGWVGPRAGLEAVVKNKVPMSAPVVNWTPTNFNSSATNMEYFPVSHMYTKVLPGCIWEIPDSKKQERRGSATERKKEKNVRIQVPSYEYKRLDNYFMPLRSKYFSEQFAVWHLRCILFLLCDRPYFSTTQRNLQNYCSTGLQGTYTSFVLWEVHRMSRVLKWIMTNMYRMFHVKFFRVVRRVVLW